MSHRFRFVWGGLLLAALLLVPASRVFAHPLVLRTEPAEGAQLAAPPAVVRVVFNEPIEAAFSSIQLLDGQRQPVATAGKRSVTDPTVLELPLAPIGAGIYTVVWQVIGSDGHAVKGNFAFVVRASDLPAAPAAQAGAPTSAATSGSATPLPANPVVIAPAATPTPPSVDVPLALVVVLRALVLLGALGIVGGWLFIFAIVKPGLLSQLGGDATVVQQWRLGNALSVLVLLVTTTLLLVVHTASVGGQLSWENISAVVGGTRFGQALALRLLLAAGLGSLVIAVRSLADLGGWRLLLALMLGGALLLTFSLSGHAAAQQAFLPAVVSDWLHLAATSVWVGGLLQLVLILPVLLRASPAASRPCVLAEVVVAFSSAALGSVFVLTFSGTYSALLHLATPADLIASDYGRALLVKLALFGGLLALGAYNLLLVRPRFVAWIARAAEAPVMLRWQRRFTWLARGEVLLAMLALLAVGVMTSSAPPDTRASAAALPATAAPLPAMVVRVSPVAATPSVATTLPPTALATQPVPTPGDPFAQRQTVGDLQVALAVEPVILGKNRFLVTLTDAASKPVAVQRVMLDLEMTAMDMGITELEAAPQGDGRYSVGEGWLSMVGDWRARVLVRRADADDVEAIFVLTVPPMTMLNAATPVPQQAVDDISIGLQTIASPVIYENQQFAVTLTDSQGKAVDRADVYLELVMLEHPMGTNQPVALSAGNGLYRADGAYTMVGRWGLTVVATVQGRVYRATFTTAVGEQFPTATPR